jgi:hypothetical protein
MKYLLAILLLASVAVASPKSNKGGKRPPPTPPPPTTVTLDAWRWSFQFGFGGFQGGTPTQSIGQPGWWFQMPRHDGPASDCWNTVEGCPQVDYVMCYHSAPITASALVITARVVVTGGAPAFQWKTEEGNNGTAPAGVRAIVWSYNAAIPMEFQRWWSNPGVIRLIDAAQGLVTLTIPITPDQWSSVYGKRGNLDASTLAGFNAALSRPYFVGLTFGGGSFFGHGVYLSGGDAEFQLLEFSFR